jgi:hypothetical protein
LIMDSAYEGDETLRLARQLGYTPIVPPNPNRLSPWELDRVAYRTIIFSPLYITRWV